MQKCVCENLLVRFGFSLSLDLLINNLFSRRATASLLDTVRDLCCWLALARNVVDDGLECT